MSMPEFPEEGLHIKEDQAFNMLLTSIAMEELALSHIINAEGEKLQYVLGTLPGACGTRPTTEEVIQVNKSISQLLETVAQNQLVLKSKLENILEARRKPTVKCKKEYIRLSSARKDERWRKGTGFPWKYNSRCGDTIRWNEETPTLICLPKDCVCAIDFQFCLHTCSSYPVRIRLEKTDGCHTTILRTFEGSGKTVEGNTVLHVSECNFMPVSLVLGSPDYTCVEKAVLSIVRIA